MSLRARASRRQHSLSAGNLGTVLESYGGKSLKRIVGVGVAIFGCALTVTILIRVFRPDYLGSILCVFTAFVLYVRPIR